MPLIESASIHHQDRELEITSLVIDNTPTICDYFLQDLNLQNYLVEYVFPIKTINGWIL